jgi:NAD+ kinase
MKSAVIVVHHERPDAASLAAATIAILTAAGLTCVMPHSDAVAAGQGALAVSDDECRAVDLAVSIGGDGTMLRTVALLAETSVPVLGVNVGVLGYLTEVEPDGLEAALRAVLAGAHHVEKRMMLEVAVETANGPRHAVGLNEAVVEKREAGHTVRLVPSINDRPFTPYAADGLIVATPTGSTAYALSARGPILSPTMRALLLTPVSPHMLFDRSLVLGAEEHVAIAVSGHRPATVSVDGRHLADLAPGDVVTCRAAAHEAVLIRFDRLDFHQRLKDKFKLADR